MRLCWTLCATLLLVAQASARRSEQDFEFDDDAEISENALSVHARRPRRYVYDPRNSLCRALVCKKRELCLLRDAFTALCANKKDILRKGDVIVSGGGSASSSVSEEDTDDVFYDGEGEGEGEGAGDLLAPDDSPRPPAAAAAAAAPGADAPAPDRCVGCGGSGSGGFLCGSDNRTYSSLCRLDLHNCVRRPAPPVALACRGFCPCGRAAPPAAPAPAAPADPAAPAAPAAPPQRRPRRPLRQRRLRARLEELDRNDWRRRKSESSHNEVLPDRPNRRRLSQGSAGCALDKMANRLLDWFSVLMEEAEAAPPPRAGFPSDCKPEVRWMFAHLDTDGDGLLSAANLYALRHDERERCLRPFLAGCGGAGAGVGPAAWCACLRRAARPCTALARAHAAAAAAGGYVPACDARGYYRPRQCHAALGVCWCVDAHGAELAGSRARGEPACPAPRAPAAPPAPAREGAPLDDEDAAGSGDAELRY